MSSDFFGDELQVLLGDLPVGVLRKSKNDAVEFFLLDSYKNSSLKPVLGQIFLDNPNEKWRVRSRVPEWFSNLLPEGMLRELVANQASVSPQREFFLLRHLGQDLPGAVRIIAPQAELSLMFEDSNLPDIERDATPGEWHFSLAGVQLKFSARENDRGLTIPVSGTGGDWIVKLPDGRFEGVPENEFATMLWAKESGLNVPPTRLVPVKDIGGLPPHIGNFSKKMAYAVQRFDRGEGGARIHIEDFAQVLGVYPEEKYKKYNYETIANVLLALDGERGIIDFVRQIVFVMASGNGDAHLKNWSLIYHDGINAQLAPAYDLVSTIQYMSEDRLALNFARSKEWGDISSDGFSRLARKIGWSEKKVLDIMDQAVAGVLAAWDQSKNYFGYPSACVQRIETHLKSIPIFKQRWG